MSVVPVFLKCSVHSTAAKSRVLDGLAADDEAGLRVGVGQRVLGSARPLGGVVDLAPFPLQIPAAQQLEDGWPP